MINFCYNIDYDDKFLHQKLEQLERDVHARQDVAAKYLSFGFYSCGCQKDFSL